MDTVLTGRREYVSMNYDLWIWWSLSSFTVIIASPWLLSPNLVVSFYVQPVLGRIWGYNIYFFIIEPIVPDGTFNTIHTNVLFYVEWDRYKKLYGNGVFVFVQCIFKHDDMMTLLT